MEEINAIASFGCRVEPIKVGRKITQVRLAWWQKDLDELKDAYAELQRPKVGRKARISGEIDQIIGQPSIPKEQA